MKRRTFLNGTVGGLGALIGMSASLEGMNQLDTRTAEFS